jgi:hypothetical protein
LSNEVAPVTDETHSPDDDELIAELRRVAGLADPVPERVLHAARGSFAWRTIDAELAQLAYDSAVDADLAAVRGPGESRLLTFDAPEVSIELEVTETDGERRLEGQLVPPQPATVEIRHQGGSVTAEADELGRFSAAALARGPVSLVCRLHGQANAIVTDWLVL